MEIRCPECGKKLGNRVVGLYVTDCPRCHRQVRFVNRGREIVTVNGERVLIDAQLLSELPPDEQQAA